VSELSSWVSPHSSQACQYVSTCLRNSRPATTCRRAKAVCSTFRYRDLVLPPSARVRLKYGPGLRVVLTSTLLLPTLHEPLRYRAAAHWALLSQFFSEFTNSWGDTFTRHFHITFGYYSRRTEVHKTTPLLAIRAAHTADVRPSSLCCLTIF